MRRRENEAPPGADDHSAPSNGQRDWRLPVALLVLLGLLTVVLNLRKPARVPPIPESRAAVESSVAYLPVESPGTLIDVNLATREQLLTIPNLRAGLVDPLIAARPFTSVDDVIRTRGIGPKTLERIRPFITVTPMPANQLNQ